MRTARGDGERVELGLITSMWSETGAERICKCERRENGG